MNKLFSFIKQPRNVLLYLLNFKLFRLIPDKTYLKIKYRLIMKKKLNLRNPQTFNEKLQWLKIYDRKPNYKYLVDKYKVREHIKNTIGEKYLIPLLGVYDNFEEIDFKSLPDKFVLKPNHTSGNVFICKDKSQIDFIKLKREIRKWLRREYFWFHREWPYKNIKPKIICEKFIVDESGEGLKDYKIMCFNGEPKIIQVISERTEGKYYINHYDVSWNSIEISRKSHKENPIKIPKPVELEEMIRISKILSKNTSFVRIDLYRTDYGVFFGEITFFPVSGYMDFENDKYDYILGNWIELK
ncbi:MAG TPA: glycosyl transferase [Gallicola sp.]|nr:glycosyl transferase [Gallicola sp.]